MADELTPDVPLKGKGGRPKGTKTIKIGSAAHLAKVIGKTLTEAKVKREVKGMSLEDRANLMRQLENAGSRRRAVADEPEGPLTRFSDGDVEEAGDSGSAGVAHLPGAKLPEGFNPVDLSPMRLEAPVVPAAEAALLAEAGVNVLPVAPAPKPRAPKTAPVPSRLSTLRIRDDVDSRPSPETMDLAMRELVERVGWEQAASMRRHYSPTLAQLIQSDREVDFVSQVKANGVNDC